MRRYELKALFPRTDSLVHSDIAFGSNEVLNHLAYLSSHTISHMIIYLSMDGMHMTYLSVSSTAHPR